MRYDNMSREELIEMIESLRMDHAFGIMNRMTAFVEYATLNNSEYVVMIDICAMHQMNHAYGMHVVDTAIKNVLSNLRDYTVYRHGGDEIVLILDKYTDIDGFISRLDNLMSANNLYAVYGVTQSNNDTLDSATKRLDDTIMSWKGILDESGLKLARDAHYVKGNSDILYC